MSRFYASIHGNRGEATRQGTEASGITGHIRGWEVGIKVEGFVNGEGNDAFRVYLTGGSGHFGKHKLIGEFTEGEVLDG